ncbi:unnamed protein product [Chrysodeixis includens]|uniref:Prostaglandin reductase 1 n=1 Tax=Chrysodeixis includens TaxID=689277 RepID=A0A9P0BLP4_CHRIL|nr:unnamed protein product [Chrysodeixis includens]
MVKARKYVVKKNFVGDPKKDDFEIVEYELPPLEDRHILVKVEWISVDPYQWAYTSKYKAPYDQFSYQVGIIQASKHKNFPVGTRVVSHHGWCDYCIMNPEVQVDGINFGVLDFGVYKLPDLQGLPASLGIGAVGMPGATAYFGLLEVCKPKAGETVVVTTAAGAVGSVAGQIAKIKGCKVIGFTGSDSKVQWLKKELGFEHAFNYKTVDVGKALREAAPNGIDCYFDSVGGELSYLIMQQMNSYGRVAICGSISSYSHSLAETNNSPTLQPLIVLKQLKVEGFIVFRWMERWPEAFADLSKWIKSGQLKAGEHVTVGFENVVDAFQGMLSGANCGKAVVKV